MTLRSSLAHSLLLRVGLGLLAGVLILSGALAPAGTSAQPPEPASPSDPVDPSAQLPGEPGEPGSPVEPGLPTGVGPEDTDPPPVPSLISPLNGATVSTNMPTFNWSSVVDASPPVFYELQVATNSFFDVFTLYKFNLLVTSYTLDVLEALFVGTWYWRVRARDSAPSPNYSAWSSPLWSFNISGEIFLLPFTAAFFSTIPDSYGIKLDAANARADVGSTTDATDGADVPDPPNPPAAPFMDIEFMPGPLQTDSRPLTGTPAGATWDFRIKPTYDESGTLPVPLTLTWNLASVPFNYLLAIQDQTNLSYTDLRATPGYLYTGTDSFFRNFKFFAQEDRPPSVTVLYPNGGTVAGVINVTAQASDPDAASPYNDKIVSINFLYSSAPYTTWYPIGPITLVSGTTASGTWSASWNTLLIPQGPGYKVRAVVSDTLGAIASDESDTAFTIVHKLFISALWPAGWLMWSYPGLPDPNTNSGQLADDIVPLYVFHYNAVTGIYDITDVATKGWGYWTRITTPTNIDIEVLPNTNPTTEIALGPAWNQIGHPYNSDKAWAAVLFRKDGVTKTLSEAMVAGWMVPYIYHYDTAAGVYVVKGIADGVLQQLIGYWIKALVSGLTLIIPSP